MPKKSAEEKKWAAESDARTLADAEEIRRSRPRAKRAVTAAKRLAVDAQKSAKATARGAGRKRR
jgi:hypothetical protein